jgi:hypothetical protein
MSYHHHFTCWRPKQDKDPARLQTSLNDIESSFNRNFQNSDGSPYAFVDNTTTSHFVPLVSQLSYIHDLFDFELHFHCISHISYLLLTCAVG